MPGKIARRVKTKPELVGSIAVPQKLHLDKRAEMILAAIGDGSDDTLLSTDELALLWGVSVDWLELGRTAGYGPTFTRVGPKMIKYRLGDARKFLRQRAYLRVSEYKTERRV